jgi:hypothetical protein
LPRCRQTTRGIYYSDSIGRVDRGFDHEPVHRVLLQENPPLNSLGLQPRTCFKVLNENAKKAS